MRRALCVATACVIMSIQAASAQAPAATNWTGWYIGVEGGLANGQAAQTQTISGVSLGYYNQQGSLFGGTVGYNWQMTNWIVGLEGDLAWARIKGQETNCGMARTGTCPTEIRGFGTARARAGMAMLSNTMMYVTGGLVYADVHAYKEAAPSTGGEDWRAGWTLGAGAEVMITPNWSVKAEYLYANFSGTQTTYIITASNTPITAAERNIHILRGGLNWHF